ncbi:MAG: methionyl-tRNA formyltransferase [candidate division Zixibacteria bacterium]
MKIVFMGTPEFACEGLVALANSPHEVLAIVTVPDKKSGRGQKLSPCEVKIRALDMGLRVFQPENLKSGPFLEEMKAIGADLFVIIAFRILPRKLYSLPPLGAINIHASILPKYRGAAPINHAILNGETETGLTSFFLARKIDGGKIIDQERAQILPKENFTSLYNRLSQLSGPFLLRTLDKIERQDFSPIEQDNSQASPAPKITSEDCMIDWNKKAKDIYNQIRAFSEKPGAYSYFENKKLKILESCLEIEEEIKKLPPGQIAANMKNLYAGTGDGLLRILRLQPEGKKIVDAPAFINGYMTAEPKQLTGKRKEVI